MYEEAIVEGKESGILIPIKEEEEKKDAWWRRSGQMFVKWRYVRKILHGALDYFGSDLTDRFTRLSILNEKFGFIYDTNYTIEMANSETLKKKCVALLGDFYDTYWWPLMGSITILLTIAVSIASCERSFSKLKLLLYYPIYPCRWIKSDLLTLLY